MRHKVLIAVVALASIASCQQITLMVAPFDSSKAGAPEIGKKVGVILNLQIWQTLQIPVTGEGRNTKGGVTWDVTSEPPTSYTEAEVLARKQTEDQPQIVLWGRAWRYGDGNVVEAFLSILNDTRPADLNSGLWRVGMPDGTSVSVGVPTRQIDFRPIVLRADLLAELKDPGGLKLYSSPTGGAVLGTTGEYFRALEQGPDSAKVVLPNHVQGWVRLPNLGREHSEVVQYSGALIRIFRHDWPGAKQLLLKVVGNPNAPRAVKIDAYLYLAVAEDKSGGDPYPWLQKAYELNPYSRTVIQYVCMSHLSALSRMSEADRVGDKGDEQRRSLHKILDVSQPLFPPDDTWISKIRTVIAKPS